MLLISNTYANHSKISNVMPPHERSISPLPLLAQQEDPYRIKSVRRLVQLRALQPEPKRARGEFVSKGARRPHGRPDRHPGQERKPQGRALIHAAVYPLKLSHSATGELGVLPKYGVSTGAEKVPETTMVRVALKMPFNHLENSCSPPVVCGIWVLTP
eukprot:6532399-Pyramimonas_sp.AAC.1